MAAISVAFGARLHIDSGIEPDGCPLDQRGGAARAQRIVRPWSRAAGQAIEIAIETVCGVEQAAHHHALAQCCGHETYRKNSAEQGHPARNNLRQPFCNEPDSMHEQRSQSDQQGGG